jgi:general secretion pathway protein J
MSRQVTPRQMSRQRGFTLIELLVALSVMALMALLSWRSIDGMTRAQAAVAQRSDQVLTLQAGLAQFKVDLNAMTQTPRVTSLDWDGRVLRISRVAPNAADGLQVVAWSRRFDESGQWLRWQSPPSPVWGNWQQSWSQAALWAQNPSLESKKSETAVASLVDWQVFYFRNNAWSNPLSSEGTGAPASVGAAVPVLVPDGIRLVLNLPPGQGMAGKLTLDWVRPSFGGDKP